MKKRLLLIVFGMMLGMMFSGCGHQASEVENVEEVAKTFDVTQRADEEDDVMLETPAPMETDGKEDVSGETKTEGKYEKYFDKKIKLDGNQERFQILRNPKKADDVKMMVEKSTVNLDRVSVDAGYAQVRVKTRDCTGDGKDDIVLMLCGGVSGAYNEIQVLTEEQGKWLEVPFPEKLWEEDFISFEKAGKKMKIGVSGTKEEAVVDDSSDDEWGTRYRICKVGKDGKATIVYQIYRGKDINKIVGKVKLTMCYDSVMKAFKIGKTDFLF